jgi:hypothetical protein
LADPVTNVNNQIIGMFSGVNGKGIVTFLGWILVLIIVLGACWWGYVSYRNKKIFNKRVTICDLVGGYYQPVARDTAKVVKIGTGGFEILFLRKFKCYRIGYGGRVGKSDYYFFVMPDGYWVNAMMSGQVEYIDKHGGLVPVVTTNPLMRAQYTSLEKQIEMLHAEKKSFMDKYGAWVAATGFVIIAGVFMWLIFREFSNISGSLSSLFDRMTPYLEKAAAKTTEVTVTS